MATAKSRLVIQLLHERQSQIRPCLQEMRAGRGTRLVSVFGQMRGMAVQINRVEVVNDPTKECTHAATRPVYDRLY